MTKKAAVEELRETLEAAPEKPAWLRAKEEAAQRAELVPLRAERRKKLEPLNEWVAIRKLVVKNKIADSGLVLTQEQSRSNTGEVIAAAPGVPLKPGDWVIYTAFPIKLTDIEQWTQDRTLELVRFEECYSRVVDDPDFVVEPMDMPPPPIEEESAT